VQLKVIFIAVLIQLVLVAMIHMVFAVNSHYNMTKYAARTCIACVVDILIIITRLVAMILKVIAVKIQAIFVVMIPKVIVAKHLEIIT
jgi:hypothetical protein